MSKKDDRRRLSGAREKLERAWTQLNPDDLTKDRWGQLQAVILFLQAKEQRLKPVKESKK